MLIHTGKSIPRFDARWDPDDKDIVWVAWDDAANGSPITASLWTVPSGWTIDTAFESQSVTTDDGTTYDKCNGALVGTTQTEGTYVLSNRATFGDGRILERSVRVLVRDA